jgi:hypothetical protein
MDMTRFGYLFLRRAFSTKGISLYQRSAVLEDVADQIMTSISSEGMREYFAHLMASVDKIFQENENAFAREKQVSEMLLKGKEDLLKGKEDLLKAKEEALAREKQVSEMLLKGKEDLLKGKEEALAREKQVSEMLLKGKEDLLKGKEDLLEEKELRLTQKDGEINRLQNLVDCKDGILGSRRVFERFEASLPEPKAFGKSVPQKQSDRHAKWMNAFSEHNHFAIDPRLQVAIKKVGECLHKQLLLKTDKLNPEAMHADNFGHYCTAIAELYKNMSQETHLHKSEDPTILKLPRSFLGDSDVCVMIAVAEFFDLTPVPIPAMSSSDKTPKPIDSQNTQ